MKSHFRTRLLATTLLIGAVGFSSPAFAQETAPGGDDATVSQGDIVVTGSRIARPDLEGNSPIVSVGSSEIALKAGSANIENVLNDLPQVTGTATSTSNNPGGGVATVDLRRLAPQRTLVLVDGRRYISYDVNQTVDLNTIPSSLISRVDVVTGGQSAVYGSDAIAGVVNFILRRDFSGVELGSSYTLTGKGDGQLWDVHGMIGTNFDDGRGNVTIFGQYTKRKPTLAGQRAFSYNALSDHQDGSPLYAAGGSPSVPQGRINVAGLGAATGLGCDIQDFGSGKNDCYEAADGYNFSPVNYLQVPQERFLFTMLGQYEINDHLRPYLEAQFVNNRVSSQLAATPINNGTPYGDGVIGTIQLDTSSTFFSPALRAALQSLDTDHDGRVTANFNYRTTQIGLRQNFDERNAFRTVAGMKGDIAAGFSYDGYYMYSRTKNSQRQLGNVAIDRFLNAVQTTTIGGKTVCASADARAAGCVAANIFGLDKLSPEALEYISIGATNLEEYSTEVASLAITNPSLYDFGAGGIGVAFGAEWRREGGALIPDTYLSTGNVAGFNPGKKTSGSYSVREFFGEARIPLLSDTFIHSLELNGAARFSHYSNAPGNVFSWSAGVEFAPIRDITFRGQYQQAVRGPSVYELYLGNTTTFAGNADRCGTAAAIAAGKLRDICLAQGVPVASLGNPAIQDPNNVNPVTFVGGNADLREETAKTYTVGAIIRPSFLPRFNATVDYYNIEISNYIVPGLGTDVIGDFCFGQFNLNYCSKIKRNSFGEIDSFTDVYANSGGLKTAGLDVSVDYSVPLEALLGEHSQLAFSFRGSRLLNSKLTPIVGLNKVIDCEGRFGANCGAPTPKWRHTFRTSLDLGTASASLQWRLIGQARDDDPAIQYGSEKLATQNYFDLSLAIPVNRNYSISGGVSNILDKSPPLAASTQNNGNGQQSNTYPTVYDVLGRTFFVSMKLAF